MANQGLTHTNLAVHLLQDVETGLAHLVADVDGALVPLATHKLGHLLAWIENANQGDESVQPATSLPVSAPSQPEPSEQQSSG